MGSAAQRCWIPLGLQPDRRHGTSNPILILRSAFDLSHGLAACAQDGVNPDGMTVLECQASCDADDECGAFDIEAHSTDQGTRSECCLFREGHTGQGATERHCYVRDGGAPANSEGVESGTAGTRFIVESRATIDNAAYDILTLNFFTDMIIVR